MTSMKRKCISFEAKLKVIEAVEKGYKTLLVCVNECHKLLSIAQNVQYVESLCRDKNKLTRQKDRKR